MDRILQITDEYDLMVIEGGAHGIIRDSNRLINTDSPWYYKQYYKGNCR